MSDPLRMSVLQLWSASQTIALASPLEKAGYHRLWVSEHHGEQSASASPFILATVVAGLTERIRTGPAGVLLYYHSPLRVAEDVRMLELLFPNRIDLGIARSREKEPVSSALLDGRQRAFDAEEHERRIHEVFTHLGIGHGRNAAEEDLAVPRSVRSTAEVWVLGSSRASAPVAGRVGGSFAFSRIITCNDAEIEAALEAYRSSFSGVGVSERPYAALLVSGACAPTDAEAEALAPAAADRARGQIVGNPERCRDELFALRDRFGLDELVFVDLCVRLDDKLRSYMLLAETCGLAT